MDHSKEIIAILSSVLQIQDRSETLTLESRLLGGLPEFDSMAVVAVVDALEDYFGFTANDDELTESTFYTVGSLVRYVAGKLGQ